MILEQDAVAVSDISRVDALDGGVAIHADKLSLELDSTLGELESLSAAR